MGNTIQTTENGSKPLINTKRDTLLFIEGVAGVQAVTAAAIGALALLGIFSLPHVAGLALAGGGGGAVLASAIAMGVTHRYYQLDAQKSTKKQNPPSADEEQSPLPQDPPSSTKPDSASPVVEVERVEQKPSIVYRLGEKGTLIAGGQFNIDQNNFLQPTKVLGQSDAIGIRLIRIDEADIRIRQNADSIEVATVGPNKRHYYYKIDDESRKIISYTFGPEQGERVGNFLTLNFEQKE